MLGVAIGYTQKAQHCLTALSCHKIAEQGFSSFIYRAALRKMEASRMTATEWRKHAAQCREVALTIRDATARRILLEAAEDYSAMATREAAVTALIPAYQAAAATTPSPNLPR